MPVIPPRFERKTMKRHVFPLLLVLSVLITVIAAEEPKTVSVTFYHSSDLHEHAAPLPRIAHIVETRRQENPNVLLVDTGDWFNKGDLTPLETRGEAIVAMMSACKYDALIPGNHDYTFGTRRLAELIDRFQLPVVAANCKWPANIKPENAVPYRVFKLNGVTVAIIGSATPISTQKTDELLDIAPIGQSLETITKQLKKEADIVVLLTHVGTPADEKLARELPDVDIIFGGHDHKKYEKLTYAPGTDTIIQHSGAVGQWLGELTIAWDGEKITDRALDYVKITKELPESAAVVKVRDGYMSLETADGPSASD